MNKKYVVFTYQFQSQHTDSRIEKFSSLQGNFSVDIFFFRLFYTTFQRRKTLYNSKRLLEKVSKPAVEGFRPEALSQNKLISECNQRINLLQEYPTRI